jgi:hypothetical protein
VAGAKLKSPDTIFSRDGGKYLIRPNLALVRMANKFLYWWALAKVIKSE